MSTGDKLDGRVNEFETVSPLPSLFGVIGCFHIPDLPWPPD